MLAGAVDEVLAKSLRPLPARIRTAFEVIDLPTEPESDLDEADDGPEDEATPFQQAEDPGLDPEFSRDRLPALSDGIEPDVWVREPAAHP